MSVRVIAGGAGLGGGDVGGAVWDGDLDVWMTHHLAPNIPAVTPCSITLAK